jgi:hypothetical protein
MALLLFPLRNVPDDEAEDIRDVLSENSISFYETQVFLMEMVKSPRVCTLGNF